METSQGTADTANKENERVLKEGEEVRNDPPDKKAKVKRIPVVEIFGPTIQGEGAMCGVRTSFIRFGLCDYRCTMCDSLHAVLPDRVKANARWLTAAEIANELYIQHGGGNSSHQGLNNAEWVTFSGGNPCIHDLEELIFHIRGLNTLGHEIKIAVETQGTLLPKWLHMCDVITVSPKSPGMGERFELDKFVEFLKQFHHHPGFNVKIVAFSMQDLEFVKSVNSILPDWNMQDRIYVSLGNPFPPGKEEDLQKVGDEMLGLDSNLKLRLLKDYRVLVEDVLSEPSLKNVKLLPQLHVLTWGNKQGV